MYLYWTISKMHFWEVFTCEGTYMIHWVGRIHIYIRVYIYAYIYAYIYIYIYAYSASNIKCERRYTLIIFDFFLYFVNFFTFGMVLFCLRISVGSVKDDHDYTNGKGLSWLFSAWETYVTGLFEDIFLVTIWLHGNDKRKYNTGPFAAKKPYFIGLFATNDSDEHRHRFPSRQKALRFVHKNNDAVRD